MTKLDALLEPLRHSPQLPTAVEILAQQVREEQEQRGIFYAEMTLEQKVEFIDGQIILHSPAKNRHLDVTLQLATLLKSFVSLHQLGTVKVEKCLCVFPRNDYEPDMVFFSREKAAALKPSTLKFPVPDLVVEVISPSTEERDLGVKFDDYAANGVSEYWIIDSESSSLEQYVLDANQDYRLVLKSSSGKLQSDVITGLGLEIEAIFDEQKNLAALRDLMA